MAFEKSRDPNTYGLVPSLDNAKEKLKAEKKAAILGPQPDVTISVQGQLEVAMKKRVLLK